MYTDRPNAWWDTTFAAIGLLDRFTRFENHRNMLIIFVPSPSVSSTTYDNRTTLKRIVRNLWYTHDVCFIIPFCDVYASRVFSSLWWASSTSNEKPNIYYKSIHHSAPYRPCARARACVYVEMCNSVFSPFEKSMVFTLKETTPGYFFKDWNRN